MELVVLARLKKDDIARLQFQTRLSYAYHAAAANHDIEFGLRVKVTRTPKGWLVSPGLRPSPAQHREGLVECGH